jgi:hypothetical protein
VRKNFYGSKEEKMKPTDKIEIEVWDLRNMRKKEKGEKK